MQKQRFIRLTESDLYGMVTETLQQLLYENQAKVVNRHVEYFTVDDQLMYFPLEYLKLPTEELFKKLKEAKMAQGTMPFISFMISMANAGKRNPTTKRKLPTGAYFADVWRLHSQNSLLSLLGEKSEYFSIGVVKKDGEQTAGRLRLSNHSMTSLNNPSTISIVVPEGKFQKRSNYTAEQMNKMNCIEFIAGVDFKYNGNAMQLADTLKWIIDKRITSIYEIADALGATKKLETEAEASQPEEPEVDGTPEVEVNPEDNMSVQDKGLQMLKSRAKDKFIKLACIYKDEILNKGIKVAPKITNRGRKAFWAALREIMTDEEKVMFSRLQTVYRHNYYTRYKDRELTMSKAYAKAHPEEIKQIKAKSREKLRAQTKAKYEANKDVINAQKRAEYAQKTPEERAAYQAQQKVCRLARLAKETPEQAAERRRKAMEQKRIIRSKEKAVSDDIIRNHPEFLKMDYQQFFSSLEQTYGITKGPINRLASKFRISKD